LRLRFYQTFYTFRLAQNTCITFLSNNECIDRSDKKGKHMNTKKLLITLALLVTAILGVAGAAFAQQETPEGGRGGRGGRGDRGFDLMPELILIVADETGLDPLDIAFDLRAGSTLAEIITENGGDVNAVIATAVETITTHVNDAVAAGTLTQEQADRFLANLEQNVTDIINGEFRAGEGGRGDRRGGMIAEASRILIDATAEATGLDAATIRQQVREGSTLAEIITANGGDVQAVIDSAVATATEEINTAVTNGRITQEQADTMIASLETRFTEAVNNPFPVMRGLEVRGLVRMVAEETGLTVQEVAEQYRAGNSLASILTANGVDVNTFIETAIAQAEERFAQAVENGRLTQEEADARLAQLREDLPAQLNEVPAVEPQSA
jgi:hypothetical protein